MGSQSGRRGLTSSPSSPASNITAASPPPSWATRCRDQGCCPHNHSILTLCCTAAGAAARRQLGPRLPGAAGRGGRGGGLELPPADLHLEGTGYWLYCTALYCTVPYCRWPPPSPAAIPSCTSPRRSPRWSRWCWGRCWPRPGCPRGSTTSCRSHITAAVPINSTSEERCPH